MKCPYVSLVPFRVVTQCVRIPLLHSAAYVMAGPANSRAEVNRSLTDGRVAAFASSGPPRTHALVDKNKAPKELLPASVEVSKVPHSVFPQGKML